MREKRENVLHNVVAGIGRCMEKQRKIIAIYVSLLTTLYISPHSMRICICVFVVLHNFHVWIYFYQDTYCGCCEQWALSIWFRLYTKYQPHVNAISWRGDICGKCSINMNSIYIFEYAFEITIRLNIHDLTIYIYSVFVKARLMCAILCSWCVECFLAIFWVYLHMWIGCICTTGNCNSEVVVCCEEARRIG